MVAAILVTMTMVEVEGVTAILVIMSMVVEEVVSLHYNS